MQIVHDISLLLPPAESRALYSYNNLYEMWNVNYLPKKVIIKGNTDGKQFISKKDQDGKYHVCHSNSQNQDAGTIC